MFVQLLHCDHIDNIDICELFFAIVLSLYSIYLVFVVYRGCKKLSASESYLKCSLLPVRVSCYLEVNNIFMYAIHIHNLMKRMKTFRTECARMTSLTKDFLFCSTRECTLFIILFTLNPIKQSIEHQKIISFMLHRK